MCARLKRGGCLALAWRGAGARAAAMAGALALGVLAGAGPPAVAAGAAIATAAPPAAAPGPKRADFKGEAASDDVLNLAKWIVDAGDHQRMPFVIVDKKDARVFVFGADAALRGAAPALLGLASGDDAAPGIGTRKLADILPEERTTPAGRFVAALGRNLHGKEILWVDYDTAISLHQVVTSKTEEQRAKRLASATPLDNRISYGCINVTVKFYQKVISPAFRQTNGIVYILPETRAASTVFQSYPASGAARMH
jgi:hypothetical protein